MSTVELVVNSVLLFIAGHETTVNLISNGMLTLLRNPDVFERLRREPALMPLAVEELLRYEPPVQMLPGALRSTMSNSGECGSPRVRRSLVLASANRDPARFAEPNRFLPDRTDNQHLGLGSGIHSCFGAPLAPLRRRSRCARSSNGCPTQDLSTTRRLIDSTPVLRGPRHLLVDRG